ncbi:tubulinyl-Tyr carboxypeptidase 1-like isoform X2 [Ruditapes philippinarum]|uniref:tubulinyl-Tyr carboxypeptidase 1-like isoform X2 n=1 Tax=Ruditapes philippinarum TaxID=129788 RepID=UPI00295AE640|nr:tubulinyl-Tyr carboxypeptidase 1-like isoform X2 [Ruditapes philippinarum]
MSKQPLCDFGTLVRISDSDEEEGGRRKRNMKRHGTHSSDGKSRPSTVSKDDQKEENGVWFWVNKNGFPIDDMTWERMWDHVAKIHPDGHKMVTSIRGGNHGQVTIPQPPTSFSPSVTIYERLEKIQNYMNTLQYNHTGTQFFEIKKNRPLSGLLEVAKDMIRESLPIKCLEAIILGVFLTNGFMGMERFAISFKTQFNGNTHRHVVLGVYHAGRYGALGMSRRDDLMYKPLIFKSLSELVLDYERAYKKYWHDVKKIKIGLPISHDPHSYEFINWKSLTLTRNRLTQQELIKEIDTHAKEIRTKGKLCWSFRTGPLLFLRKSRSWSVPQTSSPRKSHSFIDVNRTRASKSTGVQSPQSSYGQAIKLYQGATAKEVMSAGKKKEQPDISEYQIRI